MKVAKHVHCGRDYLANGNAQRAAAHFARADELRFGGKTKADRACEHCGKKESPTGDKKVTRCPACTKHCHRSCCPGAERSATVDENGPSGERDHAERELRRYKSRKEDYAMARARSDGQ